ncbi:hypothetical protein PCE1_004842 [Barthelona sp. PCE]
MQFRFKEIFSLILLFTCLNSVFAAKLTEINLGPESSQYDWVQTSLQVYSNQTSPLFGMKFTYLPNIQAAFLSDWETSRPSVMKYTYGNPTTYACVSCRSKLYKGQQIPYAVLAGNKNGFLELNGMTYTQLNNFTIVDTVLLDDKLYVLGEFLGEAKIRVYDMGYEVFSLEKEVSMPGITPNSTDKLIVSPFGMVAVYNGTHRVSLHLSSLATHTWVAEYFVRETFHFESVDGNRTLIYILDNLDRVQKVVTNSAGMTATYLVQQGVKAWKIVDRSAVFFLVENNNEIMLKSIEILSNSPITKQTLTVFTGNYSVVGLDLVEGIYYFDKDATSGEGESQIDILAVSDGLNWEQKHFKIENECYKLISGACGSGIVSSIPSDKTSLLSKSYNSYTQYKMEAYEYDIAGKVVGIIRDNPTPFSGVRSPPQIRTMDETLSSIFNVPHVPITEYRITQLEGIAIVSVFGGLNVSQRYRPALNNGAILTETMSYCYKGAGRKVWYLDDLKAYVSHVTDLTYYSYYHHLGDISTITGAAEIDAAHRFVVIKGKEVIMRKLLNATYQEDLFTLPVDGCSMDTQYMDDNTDVRLFITCPGHSKVWVSYFRDDPYNTMSDFTVKDINFRKTVEKQNPKIACIKNDFCLLKMYGAVLHIEPNYNDFTIRRVIVDMDVDDFFVRSSGVWNVDFTILNFTMYSQTYANISYGYGPYCAENQYPHTNGTCLPCEVGISAPGSLQCDVCGPFENYDAEMHKCRTAKPGEYFNVTTGTIEECPIWKYCPSDNMTLPHNCDKTRTFGKSGLTYCSYSCNQGEFYDLERVCHMCDPGTYSSSWGAPNCSIADAGYYAEDYGSIGQLACPAGSFSAAGSSECSLCLPGHYSDSEASTDCTPCAIHSATATHGSTECVECGSEEVADYGASVCDVCGDNELMLPDKSGCVSSCPGGLYAHPNGTCLDTCDNFVVLATNSCVATCPSSTIPEESAKECRNSRSRDGYYWDGQEKECPAGFYCRLEEKTECAADLYSNPMSIHSSDCKSCGNQFMKKDRTGCVSTCKADGRVFYNGECYDTCPGGSYQYQTSYSTYEDRCYPCPAGKACKDGVMTSCAVQNSRLYSLSGAANCSTCPMDKNLKYGHTGCTDTCQRWEVESTGRCYRKCYSSSHYSTFYNGCKLCPAGERCTGGVEPSIPCLEDEFSPEGDNICRFCEGSPSSDGSKCVRADSILTTALHFPKSSRDKYISTDFPINETVTDGITLGASFALSSGIQRHGRYSLGGIYSNQGGCNVVFGVSIVRWSGAIEIFWDTRGIMTRLKVPMDGEMHDLAVTLNMTTSKIFIYLDGVTKEVSHSFDISPIAARNDTRLIVGHWFLNAAWRRNKQCYVYPDFGLEGSLTAHFLSFSYLTPTQLDAIFLKTGNDVVLDYKLLLTAGGARDDINGMGLTLPSGFQVVNQPIALSQLFLQPSVSSGGVVQVLSRPDLAFMLYSGLDIDLVFTHKQSKVSYEIPVFLKDYKVYVDIPQSLPKGKYRIALITDAQAVRMETLFEKVDFDEYPELDHRFIIEFDENGEIEDVDNDMFDLIADIKEVYDQVAMNITLTLPEDLSTVDINAIIDETELQTDLCLEEEVPFNLFFSFNSSKELVGSICYTAKHKRIPKEIARDIVDVVKQISTHITSLQPGASTTALKHYCVFGIEFPAGEADISCFTRIESTNYRQRCRAWLDTEPLEEADDWADELVCPKTMNCIQREEFVRVAGQNMGVNTEFCVRPVTNPGNKTFQCCYNREKGNLLNTRASKASTRIRSMTYKHAEETLDHFFDCCVFSNKKSLCADYLKRRPNPKKSSKCVVANCNPDVEVCDAVTSVNGWNDPRIALLGERDKSVVAINSVGDFRLIKNSAFEIHSRHTKYGDGSIFSGFAISAIGVNQSLFEVYPYTETVVESEEYSYPEVLYDDGDIVLTSENITDPDYSYIKDSIYEEGELDEGAQGINEKKATVSACHHLTVIKDGAKINPCIEGVSAEDIAVYATTEGTQGSVCFRFGGSTFCVQNPSTNNNEDAPLAYNLLLEHRLTTESTGLVNPPLDLTTERQLWSWSFSHNVTVTDGNSLFTSTHAINMTEPVFADEVTFEPAAVTAAESACSNLDGIFKDACIDDVLLTGDVSFVESSVVAEAVEAETAIFIESTITSTECEMGEKKISDDSCVECSPGYFGDGSNCHICDTYAISTGYGSVSCQKCPDGYFANSLHTACETCSLPRIAFMGSCSLLPAVVAIIIVFSIFVVAVTRCSRKKDPQLNKMMINVQPSQINLGLAPMDYELSAISQPSHNFVEY